jgi:CRISPR-associated protein Csx3
MMHAILDDMLSPEAASAHLQLMQTVLQGPDGARLFDAPMPYCGGPQTLFQRAESSAFFGREIGVMYTHAHLRYAQMLAHLGQADAFFEALAKAHPLGLAAHVPSANLRQANCYFSSSDAAFTDRYQASERYAEVAHGTVPLDGGWRVYSSGPGIAIGLIVGSFLGIRRQRSTLIIDPVIPAALDGLTSSVTIGGHVVKLRYQVGPQGHGPLRLELNGTDLPFTRGDNPYRLGAAEVPMAQFLAGLRDLDDRLIVSLS